MLDTILIVAALVCFILAAFGFTASDASPMRRINFIGLGLACWIATLLVS